MEKEEVTSEIVAIGTELLLGQIVDTNSRDLAEVLARYGIIHRRRVTVGDHLGRMVEAIRSSFEQSDLTFTIGGLGPTEDDLTRQAVAEVLGEELILDEEALKALRERVEKKRPWVESLAKQCYKPVSGRLLDNPVGTAPAMICEKGERVIFCLPGPRAEFRYVLQTHVEPFLARQGQGVILSKTLRVVGIPEAVVEAQVKDLVRGKNPSVAPLVKPGEVHLRVTAHAGTEGEALELISPVVAVIKGRLGSALYGEDEEDLAEAALKLLKYRGRTVATAESCTGGLLGGRLTAIPGASEV
ncbi:MAG: CinA family nicotinamide mononucleotide deamidase-related protein, partial [Candidatus Caldarchaeum sp.]